MFIFSEVQAAKFSPEAIRVPGMEGIESISSFETAVNSVLKVATIVGIGVAVAFLVIGIAALVISILQKRSLNNGANENNAKGIKTFSIVLLVLNCLACCTNIASIINAVLSIISLVFASSASKMVKEGNPEATKKINVATILNIINASLILVFDIILLVGAILLDSVWKDMGVNY